MDRKKKYEEICFQVISAAGTAKSCYMEALELAERGKDWKGLFEEGEEVFQMASVAHMDALQAEAEGELVNSC